MNPPPKKKTEKRSEERFEQVLYRRGNPNGVGGREKRKHAQIH